jgi:hypothetical protein
MNTPKPCDTCRHLYWDVFSEEDPSYLAECTLDKEMGNLDCRNYNPWKEEISEMEQDKTYRFYWLTGKVEIHKGRNPAEALTLAGYGGGAVRALDYYEEVKEGEKDVIS